MRTKEIILDAIKSVNSELKIPELESVNDKTELFTLLDSLGTLDLILELEESLQAKTGEYIAIANEFSMNAELTPFKTTLSLEAFIDERICDAKTSV